MEVVFWLVLFTVLLLIEIVTLGLTTVWFAGGALIAMVLALLNAGLWMQIIVFLAVSTILLVLTRPLAMRYFNREREATNAERVIGEQGVVIERIDTLHAQGAVDMNGQIWSAKTESPHGVIEEGSVVEVLKIQGVKLVVRQKED